MAQAGKKSCGTFIFYTRTKIFLIVSTYKPVVTKRNNEMLLWVTVASNIIGIRSTYYYYTRILAILPAFQTQLK